MLYYRHGGCVCGGSGLGEQHGGMERRGMLLRGSQRMCRSWRCCAVQFDPVCVSNAESGSLCNTPIITCYINNVFMNSWNNKYTCLVVYSTVGWLTQLEEFRNKVSMLRSEVFSLYWEFIFHNMLFKCYHLWRLNLKFIETIANTRQHNLICASEINCRPRYNSTFLF